MSTRYEKQEQFIDRLGWTTAQSEIIAGDASNRKYMRLTQHDNSTAILMDAPPEKGENVRPFIKVLNFLRQNGLEAPDLYGQNAENGFLLLEDLGDALFARICCATPDIEDALYHAAADVLIKLHSVNPPQDTEPYDLSTYTRETDLLTEWYLPAVLNQPTSSSLTESLQHEIANICNPIFNDKPVLVLRDYHAENLLWLPNRKGGQKVGLLDFQDALVGHPAYDLVSLLEDARRDTSDALQISVKSYFLKHSGYDTDHFNYAYAALGAQRNLKIIGIFARLCVRDAKPHYVDLIPRVWNHLQKDLSHPDLNSLKKWIEQHMPKPTQQNLDKIKNANRIT